MDSNKILFSDPYYKDLVEKDLFELMGFTNLSTEKRNQLTKAALETISERAIARILDQVTDQDKFSQITENQNFEQIVAYLKSINIDVEKLFSEEALIYKNEMVQSAKIIKNNLSNPQNKEQ